MAIVANEQKINCLIQIRPSKESKLSSREAYTLAIVAPEYVQIGALKVGLFYCSLFYRITFLSNIFSGSVSRSLANCSQFCTSQVFHAKNNSSLKFIILMPVTLR